MALNTWTEWQTVQNWYEMQYNGVTKQRDAVYSPTYPNGVNAGKSYFVGMAEYEEREEMPFRAFNIEYRMKMATKVTNLGDKYDATMYQFRLKIPRNPKGYSAPVRVSQFSLSYVETLRGTTFVGNNFNSLAEMYEIPTYYSDEKLDYGYWDHDIPNEDGVYDDGGLAPPFPYYDDESEYSYEYSIFSDSYEDTTFGTVSTFKFNLIKGPTLTPSGGEDMTTWMDPIYLTVPCYPSVSALVFPNTATGYKFGDTYKTTLQTWWPGGSKVDVEMKIGNNVVKTISVEDNEKHTHEPSISIDPNNVGQYVKNSMDTTVNIITTTSIKINGVYEVLGEYRASPTWSFKNYNLNNRISKPTITRYNSVPLLIDWDFGVTGKSGYGWNINVSEMYSSPIKATVTVRRDKNETYMTSDSLSDTTKYLTKAGYYSIFVRVEDGRGMTGSGEFELGTIVDDGLPSIDGTSISRRDAFGQESEYGHYGLLNIVASPYSIKYKNVEYNSIASITATYKTKDTKPKTYTAIKTQSDFPYLIPNVNDIESGSITDYEFSPGHSYSIEVTVTDILGNKKSMIVDLAVSRTTFHLKNGGNGLGFGQYCDVPETIQSAWPMFVLGRELSHCDTAIDQKTDLITAPHNGAYIRIKTPGTYMLIGVSDRKILTDNADHLRDGVDFRVRPFSGSTTPTFHIKSFYAPFDSTINSELVAIPKTIGIALFRLVEGSVEAKVSFGVLDTTAEEGNTMWSQYQNENSTLYAFRLGQYIENSHDEGL